MKSKSTPDERFMQKLYEIALSKGDPLCEIEIKVVATAVGLKETAVKNIIKHLAQANFLVKIGKEHISLTERGCAFVQELE